MRIWFGLFAIAFVTASSCFADDQIIYRGYTVTTWPRAEQFDVLRQIAGEKGKVIEDRLSGKLMILATTNAHVQVAAFLADADVPVRNVRIGITTKQSGTQTKSGFEVQGSGRIAATAEGIGYKIKVKPVVVDESSGMNSLVRQTIMVSEGCEASITVGQEVPYFDWLWETGQRWGNIPRDMTMREVGAFLTVQPFVVGDGQFIRMKLTPELRGMVGSKSTRIQFTKVSTEVTVRNGASFPIGGLGKDAQFSSKFLVGFSSEGQTESLQITVTPQIVGPDGKDITR
ncbi:MAG: hypothetical protein WCN95_13995 [bacterium]